VEGTGVAVGGTDVGVGIGVGDDVGIGVGGGRGVGVGEGAVPGPHPAAATSNIAVATARINWTNRSFVTIGFLLSRIWFSSLRVHEHTRARVFVERRCGSSIFVFLSSRGIQHLTSAHSDPENMLTYVLPVDAFLPPEQTNAVPFLGQK
jgi:hypothetical protein